MSLWMLGTGALQGAAQGLFGGGGQAPTPGATTPFVTNPFQQRMQQQMQQRAMSGAGDFGYGSFVKQGKSQLQNFLAQQGIAQGSGVGVAGMGNMLAQASGIAAQNRHRQMMDIASLSPAIAMGERGDNLRNLGMFDPTGRFAKPGGGAWNPYDPNNLPGSTAPP